MTIELDGRRMTDRAAAHDYLRSTLCLPDHYGRNLDALYDLLTEISAPVTINVLHKEALDDNLGPYGAALLNTLRDAARKNPMLTITF